MLYKDMEPAELRRHYVSERNAAYGASRLAQSTSPKSRGGRMVARQWGGAMRRVELIEAVARKRGISLTGPTD